MDEYLTEVTFTGGKPYKLDGKGRASVPPGWAAIKADALFLLKAKRDGYPILKCYTKAGFARLIAEKKQYLKEKGCTPADIDLYARHIHGQSEEIEFGTQGKLLIPKEHRERLHLVDSVHVVGCGSYFELWNADDYEASRQKDLDKIAQMDLEIGLFGD